MKTLAEYVGNVLPDGHLSVPEEVRQVLGLEPHAQVQVTLRLLQPDAEQVQEAWTVFRQMGQGAAQAVYQTPLSNMTVTCMAKEDEPGRNSQAMSSSAPTRLKEVSDALLGSA